MTSTALYKKLCTLVLENAEEIPEKGFKTVKEWQKEFGQSKFPTLKLIRRLKGMGKVEIKSFKRKWAHGVRPVAHYKITA